MTMLSTRGRVLSLLRAEGPCDRKQIAEIMAVDPLHLRGVLGPLVRDKLLEREAEGPGGVVYRLSSNGKEYCRRVYGAAVPDPSVYLPRTEPIEAEVLPEDPLQTVIRSWEHMTVSEAGDVEDEIEICGVKDPPSCPSDSSEIASPASIHPEDYISLVDAVDGTRSVHQFSADSWVEESIELARQTMRPVSVYRLQLVGQAVLDVVFRPVC